MVFRIAAPSEPGGPEHQKHTTFVVKKNKGGDFTSLFLLRHLFAFLSRHNKSLAYRLFHLNSLPKPSMLSAKLSELDPDYLGPNLLVILHLLATIIL